MIVAALGEVEGQQGILAQILLAFVVDSPISPAHNVATSITYSASWTRLGG